MFVAGFGQAVHAAGNEIEYGLVAEDVAETASKKVTAVAYPNFTSSNVNGSTAVFTFLVSAGTAIVEENYALGGTWTRDGISAAEWATTLGRDPAELRGYDIVQFVMSPGTLNVGVAGQFVAGQPYELFSFTLPDGCSETNLQMFENDSPLQATVFTYAGANINNQIALSVDDKPSTDKYAGNAPEENFDVCSPRAEYGLIIEDVAGETSKKKVTAVVYPDFTSSDVNGSTAVFTFLVSAGTAIVEENYALGGTWTRDGISAAEWATTLGRDPAELRGYDIVQFVMSPGTLNVGVAGQFVAGQPYELFSFTLPDGCSETNLQMFENDSPLQATVFTYAGANINNQISISVDDEPSTDTYAGNAPEENFDVCSPRVEYGLIAEDVAETASTKVTAVVYPDFTSSNVNGSTAVFTFLVSAGTTIEFENYSLGGTWTRSGVSAEQWGEIIDRDPAELGGYDIVQFVMSPGSLNEGVAGQFVSGQPYELFSFTLPDGCSGVELQMFENDSPLQQTILTYAGANINNQISLSVDDEPSTDTYARNAPKENFNVCLSAEDSDGDSILDVSDNCPTDYNPNQLNFDNDQFGDVCDTDDDNDLVLDGPDCLPLDSDKWQLLNGALDQDNDGIGAGAFIEICSGASIESGYSVVSGDNCPAISNADQLNTDDDSQGNACDNNDDNDALSDTEDCAPLDDSLWQQVDAYTDSDSDGFGTGQSSSICVGSLPSGFTLVGGDNCPSDSNPGQLNTDGDEQGDSCDADIDNDGVFNSIDLDELDPKICSDDDDDLCDDCSQGVDGFGPLSDNDVNNDGLDSDSDGQCNVSDVDDDNDNVLDEADNCPTVANPLQEDGDSNGVGDACEVEEVEDGDLCIPVKTQIGTVVVICL